MNKEIEKILEIQEDSDYKKLSIEDILLLKEYITNLHNQLKEKTYLYNKLDTESKYTITKLQEENEFLKLNNPEMNMEHFRIIKENKIKIDNLREENKKLNDELKRLHDLLNSQAYRDLDNYKSRNEKALNILNGGDDDE